MIVCLPLLLQILYIVIIFSTVDEAILKLNLAFQSRRFPALPKSYDENLNILRTISALTVKQQAFFIIIKELSLKQIKPTFLEGGSQTLNKEFPNVCD